MLRLVIVILAIVAMLTQSVLGVAPGAVLCIRGVNDVCGIAPVAPACTCCCAEEAAPQDTVIRLCTPCRDECNDCIEIDLPDETVPTTIGPDRIPALAFLMQAYHIEHAISSPMAVAKPTFAVGTGPPELRRSPDALIVSSTILLL